jgi:hypothetical protein
MATATAIIITVVCQAICPSVHAPLINHNNTKQQQQQTGAYGKH